MRTYLSGASEVEPIDLRNMSLAEKQGQNIAYNGPKIVVFPQTIFSGTA